jgi:tetratricopeptide (TPR) repeat protein
VARLTRHELKQDELRTTYEQFEQWAKTHYKEIATVVGLLVVVVGLAAGLKFHTDRQEAAANAELGAALRTFRAYVGAANPETLGPQGETYSTAQEKYRKALGQFTEVVAKFPRTKAAAIARYHVGLCQAQLGDQAAASKTLQEASRGSDRSIASLAQLALAGELTRSGRLAEAVKVYQDLADHPTSTVPRSTALLALADAYRSTQPAKAREIYEQLEKQFAANAALAQAVKEQMASLPE